MLANRQTQIADLKLLAEVGIQIRITLIHRLIDSINNEIGHLVKIMKAEKQWVRI